MSWGLHFPCPLFSFCCSAALGSLSTVLSPRLTIYALQLGGQHGLQSTAAVSKCALQLSTAAVGQVLLHLTGAAGVALGADAQVLTCGEYSVREGRALGVRA